MANYYYGEELLPQVPQDVVSANPYYWIRKGSSSYSVMLAPHPWYVNSGMVYIAESCTNYVYTLPIGGTEWTLSNTYNDEGGFGSTGQIVIFTSHNIPSGSPTSSTIWIYGSEPVPESGAEEDPDTYMSVTDIFADISRAEAIRNNSRNDNGTDTVTGVDWFSYAGNVCSSVYVSGNSWIGLGASAEHMKVNRRDGASVYVYREEGTLFGYYRFLRIRFSGHSAYNQTSNSYKLTYDLILWDTGDISLHMVDIPTSNYNGVFSLGSTSYTAPTVTAPDVTFVLQEDNSYIVSYDVIGLLPPFERRYLVRSGPTIYTVADGALVVLQANELTAQVFLDSGVEDLPDGSLLVGLVDPEVLFWQESTEYALPTLTATVTGVPLPQSVISNKIDLSHETITGIESALATCTGDLIVAVSFDGKATWKAWNGSAWATLSEDFTGMNKAALEAITFEQWNEMYTGANGFYVRISLLDTTQSVEKIYFDFSN